MPQIYLPKELYDRIIRQGDDPTEFVREVVTAALKKGKAR